MIILKDLALFECLNKKKGVNMNIKGKTSAELAQYADRMEKRDPEGTRQKVGHIMGRIKKLTKLSRRSK